MQIRLPRPRVKGVLILMVVLPAAPVKVPNLISTFSRPLRGPNLPVSGASHRIYLATVRSHKALKHTHNPQGVMPEQRVKEFPSECLWFEPKNYFVLLAVTRWLLNLALSGVIELHKRMQLARIDLNHVRLEIAKSLEMDVHTRGETLPECHCVCCHCQLKEEIEGHDVSVIFDGTTRLGEAIPVVVRFVVSQWRIQQ